VINLVVALLDSYFERVDNLDLPTILSAEESTKDYMRMRPGSWPIKMDVHQKGG